MNTEEIKAMKISRTDLVKTCAAEQMRELEDEDLELEVNYKRCKEKLEKALEHWVFDQHSALIKQVVEVTDGRTSNILYQTLFIGEKEGVVSVSDGLSYDYNFKLQFRVSHTKVIYEFDEYKSAHSASAKVSCAIDNLSAMTTKAREDLIKEALDSTEEGKEALDALSRMRRALK